MKVAEWIVTHSLGLLITALALYALLEVLS